MNIMQGERNLTFAENGLDFPNNEWSWGWWWKHEATKFDFVLDLQTKWRVLGQYQCIRIAGMHPTVVENGTDLSPNNERSSG